jgi:hypothetical protein
MDVDYSQNPVIPINQSLYIRVVVLTEHMSKILIITHTLGQESDIMEVNTTQ